MRLLKLLALIAVALRVADATGAPRLHPNVRRSLQDHQTVNIFVTFQNSTRSVLESTEEKAFGSRGAMITALVRRLKAHAAESQEAVSKLVSLEMAAATGDAAPPMKTTLLWITNTLHIQGATASLVAKLATMPEIREIYEESTQPPPPPPMLRIEPLVRTARDDGKASWGFEQMRIPEVWALGLTGEGVTVGEIDTGVRVTHEAIRDNWIGEYGWLDPVEGRPEPYDSNGHGTATISNLAGRNGVGVAPDAKWMLCRNCHEPGCAWDKVLLQCMQFMLCPTDPSGGNEDCSKAPRVVNNSWGAGPGYHGFDLAVEAWHKANIFGIFSAGNEGNSGASCRSIRSPAGHPLAFTIGSSGPMDALSSFSSLGYGQDDETIKPEIVAPGEGIPVATNEGDASYGVSGGTSLASPLVAGIVALMVQANPGLTVDEIRSALTTSVNTEEFMVAPHACTNGTDGSLPNNQFGFGRADAFDAVKEVTDKR